MENKDHWHIYLKHPSGLSRPGRDDRLRPAEILGEILRNQAFPNSKQLLEEEYAGGTSYAFRDD